MNFNSSSNLAYVSTPDEPLSLGSNKKSSGRKPGIGFKFWPARDSMEFNQLPALREDSSAMEQCFFGSRAFILVRTNLLGILKGSRNATKWIPELVKSGPKEKGAKNETPKRSKIIGSPYVSVQYYTGEGGDGGGGALSPFPNTLVLRKSGNLINWERVSLLFGDGFRKTKEGDMELAARPGGSSIIQGSQNEPRNEPKFGPNRIAHVASKRLPPRSQEGFRSFCNLCANRCTGKPL